MQQKHFKHTFIKTASALAFTAASMGMMSDASAKPEWAVKFKVGCVACHTSAAGDGGNATVAARNAFKNGGVVPGLQNFLKPALVDKFSVTNATWTANKLTLTGNVIFKKTVSAAAKAAAIKSLRLNVKSNSNKAVVTPVALVVNASTGTWTRIFPLTATKVPCIVKAEYEGLKATARAVKPISTTCVK